MVQDNSETKEKRRCKMYISQLITLQEMKKWTAGNNILIHAPTGTGKSHFVFTKLARYCQKNQLKMLIFSNRDILKQQNKRLAQCGVECYNYQFLEQLPFEEIRRFLEKFDIVDFDECHYFFKDSDFNKNTDNVLRYAMLSNKQIKLFASATPEPLKLANVKFDYEYQIEPDYSFIKEITFYRTPGEILNELLEDEAKSLCFFSRASEAAKFAAKHRAQVRFVCSASHHLWEQASQETIQEIITKSRFKCQVLAATTVLDNGINIKDKEVKNIMIDYCDPITIIQALGRKRLDKNERVKLYLRLPTQTQMEKLNSAKPRFNSFSSELYARYKQRLLPGAPKMRLHRLLENTFWAK